MVDEAKRYVQQSCPEWTDHNVSDPGVTLIETFAHMVDQLVYRLNRVPEKNYLAVPGPAGRAAVPARRGQGRGHVLAVRAATGHRCCCRRAREVATARAETARRRWCSRPPTSCRRAVRADRGWSPAPPTASTTDRTDDLAEGRDVPCFQSSPAAGDAMLFGLSDPGAALRRSLCGWTAGSRASVSTRGSRRWCGRRGTAQDWVAVPTRRGQHRRAEPARRGRAARSGRAHRVGGRQATGPAGCAAGSIEPERGQPFYSESPTIREAEAFTIGGTTTAEHAETVTDVLLGESEGVPGQRFPLRPDRRCWLDGDPDDRPGVRRRGLAGLDRGGALRPRPARPTGTSCWTPSTGEFLFPPARARAGRDPAASYGAVPPQGPPSGCRVTAPAVAGPATSRAARSPCCAARCPYVAGVENREAAIGGVDGETVAEAKVRAPQPVAGPGHGR